MLVSVFVLPFNARAKANLHLVTNDDDDGQRCFGMKQIENCMSTKNG